MSDAQDVERLAPFLPVEDLAEAVDAWSALLGVAPTFVDGDRWAQFDVAGTRLGLAGTDRPAAAAGVMVKVRDLAAARERALASGLFAGEVEEGPHEVRCLITGPGGWPVVLYAARKA